jgi:hypothetical protein
MTLDGSQPLWLGYWLLGKAKAGKSLTKGTQSVLVFPILIINSRLLSTYSGLNYFVSTSHITDFDFPTELFRFCSHCLIKI